MSRKIQAKYSIEYEQQAREWIEQIINETLPNTDFHTCLKNGVVLCKYDDDCTLGVVIGSHLLLNRYRVIGKLVPGKGKYKVSKVPFAQVRYLYAGPFGLVLRTVHTG